MRFEEKFQLKGSHLILFSYVLVFALLLTVRDLTDDAPYSYPSLISFLFCVLFFIVSFLYKPIRELYLKALDFTVLKKWTTYVWIISGLVLYFILNHLFYKYDWFMSDFVIDYYRLGIPIDFIPFHTFLFYIVISCLLTGIWEELFFRVFSVLFLSRWFPLMVSAVIHAVIFGYFHPGSQVLDGIFGLLLFIVFYKTKSIIPSIILHTLFNLYYGFIMFYTFDFIPRW